MDVAQKVWRNDGEYQIPLINLCLGPGGGKHRHYISLKESAGFDIICENENSLEGISKKQTTSFSPPSIRGGWHGLNRTSPLYICKGYFQDALGLGTLALYQIR